MHLRERERVSRLLAIRYIYLGDAQVGKVEAIFVVGRITIGEFMLWGLDHGVPTRLPPHRPLARRTMKDGRAVFIASNEPVGRAPSGRPVSRSSVHGRSSRSNGLALLRSVSSSNLVITADSKSARSVPASGRARARYAKKGDPDHNEHAAADQGGLPPHVASPAAHAAGPATRQ